jgi:hypothetical protein
MVASGIMSAQSTLDTVPIPSKPSPSPTGFGQVQVYYFSISTCTCPPANTTSSYKSTYKSTLSLSLSPSPSPSSSGRLETLARPAPRPRLRPHPQRSISCSGISQLPSPSNAKSTRLNLFWFLPLVSPNRNRPLHQASKITSPVFVQHTDTAVSRHLTSDNFSSICRSIAPSILFVPRSLTHHHALRVDRLQPVAT